jgi:predicted permease
MNILDSYYALSPIIIFFIIGIVLVKLDVFDASMGRNLLKFNYFVVMPSLVFTIISQMTFEAKYFPYFITYILFYGIGISISVFVVNKLFKDKRSAGAAALIIFIPNNGFILPFLIEKFGAPGVERYVATEIPNWIIVCTIGYAMAVYYGHRAKMGSDKKLTRQEKKKLKSTIIKKLLFAPPIWGVVLGLIVNYLNIKLPTPVDLTLEKINLLVTPLVVIGTGMTFNLKLGRLKQVSKVLLFHYINEIIVLVIVISTFTPNKYEMGILVPLILTPTGFNAITFSSLEDLDYELASEAISVSIPIALVTTPLIFAIFS